MVFKSVFEIQIFQESYNIDPYHLYIYILYVYSNIIDYVVHNNINNQKNFKATLIKNRTCIYQCYY